MVPSLKLPFIYPFLLVEGCVHAPTQGSTLLFREISAHQLLCPSQKEKEWEKRKTVTSKTNRNLGFKSLPLLTPTPSGPLEAYHSVKVHPVSARPSCPVSEEEPLSIFGFYWHFLLIKSNECEAKSSTEISVCSLQSTNTSPLLQKYQCVVLNSRFSCGSSCCLTAISTHICRC